MIDRARTAALGSMTLIAAAAAGLIAISDEVSRDRIAANQRDRVRAILTEVLGSTRFDNELEATRRALAPPTQRLAGQPSAVYLASYQGTPAAVVFEAAAPNGYNGPIELLIGVTSDGRVTGVRVTAHRETPGLGDAIETAKSDWIEVFDGTRLSQSAIRDWRVKKDGGSFDAITGATVTPRAIVEAVRNALEYHRDHRTELYTIRPEDD